MSNPTFTEAFTLFAKIGLLSFGGPAGQIALLHRELVDSRKWLDEPTFLNALNFCMLLPGPEAMQLATYSGWKLHGVRGGLAAGILFVLPGAVLMLALSAVYARYGNVPWITALLWGVKAAVVAIVLEALLKVARKALKSTAHYVIAAFAFVALFVFALPFPMVIAVAAVFGYFTSQKNNDVVSTLERPSITATARTVATWGVVWLVPLAALIQTYGKDHIFSELARIFSVLAVVTFGGAYSVLASLGQDIVEKGGWLQPQVMIDGLALAETTPGPLILVGQFVSFNAATQNLGTIWAGVIASAIFLWMTFVPCFLWIFAGAPWIEYLRGNAKLSGALSAITAAVVGVILNLSLWFALHVVFVKAERLAGPVPIWWPDLSTFDPAALVLSLAMAAVLLWWKLGIPKTLALAAVAGLLWKLLAT